MDKKALCHKCGASCPESRRELEDRAIPICLDCLLIDSGLRKQKQKAIDSINIKEKNNG